MLKVKEIKILLHLFLKIFINFALQILKFVTNSDKLHC